MTPTRHFQCDKACNHVETSCKLSAFFFRVFLANSLRAPTFQVLTSQFTYHLTHQWRCRCWSCLLFPCTGTDSAGKSRPTLGGATCPTHPAPNAADKSRSSGLPLEESGRRLKVSQQCIGQTLRGRPEPSPKRIRCRVCDGDINPAGGLRRAGRLLSPSRRRAIDWQQIAEQLLSRAAPESFTDL